MHHTEKHVAGLVVRLLDIGFHRLGERFVARLVALYNLSAPLVDDDDVVIFVDYFHTVPSSY